MPRQSPAADRLSACRRRSASPVIENSRTRVTESSLFGQTSSHECTQVLMESMLLPFPHTQIEPGTIRLELNPTGERFS
jgi:hypothetical protein